MIHTTTLQKLARRRGTPLFVVDHGVLRRNYAEFKRHLPRVQAYYAVKANADPAIVRTFYRIGASFDVASMSRRSGRFAGTPRTRGWPCGSGSRTSARWSSCRASSARRRGRRWT
jgi:hypothetical protein